MEDKKLLVWDIVHSFSIDTGFDKLNPTASFQIFKSGQRGFIHSLRGKHFLSAMPDMGPILEKYDLHSLEGHMIPEVAQIIKTTLKGLAEVEIGKKEKVAEGLILPWVTIRF